MDPYIKDPVEAVEAGESDSEQTAGGDAPPESNPGERVKVASIRTQDNPAKLKAVVDAAARGELDIPIAKTFPLAELGAAHTAFAAAPQGKIVITH